jgi:riboflavin synthase
MFTGIVAQLGSLGSRTGSERAVRLAIDAGVEFMKGVEIGDSIAVSGVCLTVTAVSGAGFSTDVSAESLARTTLGLRQQGDPLNLERAVLMGDRLDGHLVTGHVDGVARLLSATPDEGSRRLLFEAPQALMRYIAPKGSVCVDGVSLTVNEVDGCTFSVYVIPHTLEVTTLGHLNPGQDTNIEVDLIARYIERLHSSQGVA